MRGLLFALGVLVVGCAKPSSVTCEDGTLCPQGKACDLRHDERCVEPTQLQSCVGMTDGDACTIVMENDGICDQEVCVVERCGDGYTRGDEECDGDSSPLRDCTDFNFYVSRQIGCTADCTYERKVCEQWCGDGVFQDEFEICETDTPPDRTCVDYGYGTGRLGCLNCGPETSECVELGWKVENPPAGLFEIHGVSDTEIYGAAVKLYRSDGTKWTEVDLSSCGTASVFLEQVWAPAPGVVFGAGGSLVIRVANGVCTAWELSIGFSISDLWASDSSNAYVTTVGNGVWRFDGTTWSQQAGTPMNARLLWGSGPSNVYVAEHESNKLYRFNGTTWSLPQTLSALGEIRALWGTGPSDVYAAGHDPTFPGTRAVVLRFNGTAWSPLFDDEPLLRGDETMILGGWTVGNRVFVSAYGADSFRQYNRVFEHDGTGWVDLEAPILQALPLWASPSGRLYVPQGPGKPVHVLPRMIHKVTPNALYASNFVGIVAAAADTLYGSSGGIFGYWDGLGWVNELAGIGLAYDIAAAPSGELFAIGNQGLFRRAGTTWTELVDTNGTNITALGATDVWWIAPAVSEIQRWTGGSTLTSYSYATDTLVDIWGVPPATVIAVGNGGAAVHWTGAGFTQLPTGTTNALVAVWGRSPTDVFAGGNRLLLHFDGSTWSPVEIPDGTNILSIWGTATELFLGTETGLLRHDGQVWMPVTTGSANGITGIAGVGDSIVFTDLAGAWHQIVRLDSW